MRCNDKTANSYSYSIKRLCVQPSLDYCCSSLYMYSVETALLVAGAIFPARSSSPFRIIPQALSSPSGYFWLHLPDINICSVQSRNFSNLKIVLHILRIRKLRANLRIVH